MKVGTPIYRMRQANQALSSISMARDTLFTTFTWHYILVDEG